MWTHENPKMILCEDDEYTYYIEIVYAYNCYDGVLVKVDNETNETIYSDSMFETNIAEIIIDTLTYDDYKRAAACAFHKDIDEVEPFLKDGLIHIYTFKGEYIFDTKDGWLDINPLEDVEVED